MLKILGVTTVWDTWLRRLRRPGYLFVLSKQYSMRLYSSVHNTTKTFSTSTRHLQEQDDQCFFFHFEHPTRTDFLVLLKQILRLTQLILPNYLKISEILSKKLLIQLALTGSKSSKNLANVAWLGQYLAKTLQPQLNLDKTLT